MKKAAQDAVPGRGRRLLFVLPNLIVAEKGITGLPKNAITESFELATWRGPDRGDRPVTRPGRSLAPVRLESDPRPSTHDRTSMLLQILRRTAALVASLVVSSMLVFVFMALLPGDPARVALGVNAPDAVGRAAAAAFGLDRPLVTPVPLVDRRVPHGDFGTSLRLPAAIGPQIVDRLQVTLWLVVGVMVLALVIAIPLGTIMALDTRRPAGRCCRRISQVGVAVPAFLAGILLVTVFAVKLQWLPANG